MKTFLLVISLCKESCFPILYIPNLSQEECIKQGKQRREESNLNRFQGVIWACVRYEEKTDWLFRK